MVYGKHPWALLVSCQRLIADYGEPLVLLFIFAGTSSGLCREMTLGQGDPLGIKGLRPLGILVPPGAAYLKHALRLGDEANGRSNGAQAVDGDGVRGQAVRARRREGGIVAKERPGIGDGLGRGQ